MLECLRLGRVAHEGRSFQDAKNLLASGELTEDEAVLILASVRGQQAQQATHHYDPDLPIWIMLVGGVRWYLKLYLVGEDLICLSFHRSEEHG